MIIEKWEVIKESNGMHYDSKHGKECKIYCPINGWDCPYYDEGVCYIADPVEECDDFNSFFESWEEWEDAE